MRPIIVWTHQGNPSKRRGIQVLVTKVRVARGAGDLHDGSLAAAGQVRSKVKPAKAALSKIMSSQTFGTRGTLNCRPKFKVPLFGDSKIAST